MTFIKCFGLETSFLNFLSKPKKTCPSGLTVTGYEVNRIWWEGEHSTPHFIKIGMDFCDTIRCRFSWMFQSMLMNWRRKLVWFQRSQHWCFAISTIMSFFTSTWTSLRGCASSWWGRWMAPGTVTRSQRTWRSEPGTLIKSTLLCLGSSWLGTAEQLLNEGGGSNQCLQEKKINHCDHSNMTFRSINKMRTCCLRF